LAKRRTNWGQEAGRLFTRQGRYAYTLHGRIMLASHVPAETSPIMLRRWP
jgi:hypothetical protein